MNVLMKSSTLAIEDGIDSLRSVTPKMDGYVAADLKSFIEKVSHIAVADCGMIFLTMPSLISSNLLFITIQYREIKTDSIDVALVKYFWSIFSNRFNRKCSDKKDTSRRSSRESHSFQYVRHQFKTTREQNIFSKCRWS